MERMTDSSIYSCPSKSALNNIQFKDIVEKTSLIDTQSISEGVAVWKYSNRAVCQSIGLPSHKFVLADIKLNSMDNNTKWTLEVINIKSWMAFGICFKETVINNNYRLNGYSRKFKHGCFVITSKGLILNNNNTETPLKVLDFPQIQKGDKIEFEYVSLKSLLIIKIRSKYVYEISQIDKVKEYDINFDTQFFNLVPCVILMNFGDEIEFNLVEEN